MATRTDPSSSDPPTAEPTAAAPGPQIDQDVGSDTDSALGEDSNSTASLRSSILEFREENGRTYHSFRDGRYLIPNDEQENERLDIQHHLWALTLEGKLGLSPPHEKGASPERVLDVGTGTGSWAIDFADEHPNSQVIGIDLSPIQPQDVPPNLQFFVDDIEDSWNFQYKFDYIHSRDMNCSLANWKEYLKKCYDGLKPGGILELQEWGTARSSDGTLTPDTSLAQAMDLMERGAEKAGRPIINPWELKPMLVEAGFVDVVEHHYVWPTNNWPKDRLLKEIGKWSNINLREGMEGFLMAYATRLLGWDPKEVVVLAAKVRNDLNNRHIHAYGRAGVAYGRKPEA